MAGRRLLYLAVIELCLVFYVAYREWFAWLLLVAVACLPLLSLMLSLPAMLTLRVQVSVPEVIGMETPLRPEWKTPCKLPVPPVRCRLKVRHSITGDKQILKRGKSLQPEHCGVLELQPCRIWVYDYLGLWRLPKRCRETFFLTVLPSPVKLEHIPSLERCMSTAWKPKAGGFAENHDLRLYRPGDDLRQLHWKLSAKTGKLIVREPLEPVRKRLLLTVTLSGTADQLDDKLGRLLWLSSYLLERRLPHEIHCLTGNGIADFTVTDTDSLIGALRQLLWSPLTKEQNLSVSGGVHWKFHIGGEQHEA